MIWYFTEKFNLMRSKRINRPAKCESDSSAEGSYKLIYNDFFSNFFLTTNLLFSDFPFYLCCVFFAKFHDSIQISRKGFDSLASVKICGTCKVVVWFEWFFVLI